MKTLISIIILTIVHTSSVSNDLHVHNVFNKIKEKVIVYYIPPEPDPVQLECMALNIYFESALEPREGKIAIGQVVLNRVEHSDYPNTVCEVVKQGIHYNNGLPVKNKCQFSWYCDGLEDEPWKGHRWYESYDIAHKLLSGYPFYDFAEGSLFYHARYVKPWWAKHYERVATIGQHIFYRM
jgi:spore germination cell wall hydrolase CwlJ-like protein